MYGFPCGSAGKESTCNAGDLGSILGLGRSPGEGKGHPLQYSGLENSTDCIVHGVTKSWTRLSDFHFHFPQPLKDCGYSPHNPRPSMSAPFVSSSVTFLRSSRNTCGKARSFKITVSQIQAGITIYRTL